jgi:hypothetical protein
LAAAIGLGLWLAPKLFEDEADARLVLAAIVTGLAAVALALAVSRRLLSEREGVRREAAPAPEPSVRAKRMPRPELKDEVEQAVKAETAASPLNLSEVDLKEAVLSGVELRKADLRNADLKGADLRAADMRLADLRGADLRFASLDETKLAGCLYSGATKWPPSLNPVEAGAVLIGESE